MSLFEAIVLLLHNLDADNEHEEPVASIHLENQSKSQNSSPNKSKFYNYDRDIWTQCQIILPQLPVNFNNLKLTNLKCTILNKILKKHNDIFEEGGRGINNFRLKKRSTCQIIPTNETVQKTLNDYLKMCKLEENLKKQVKQQDVVDLTASQSQSSQNSSQPIETKQEISTQQKVQPLTEQKRKTSFSKSEEPPKKLAKQEIAEISERRKSSRAVVLKKEPEPEKPRRKSRREVEQKSYKDRDTNTQSSSSSQIIPDPEIKSQTATRTRNTRKSTLTDHNADADNEIKRIIQRRKSSIEPSQITNTRTKTQSTTDSGQQAPTVIKSRVRNRIRATSPLQNPHTIHKRNLNTPITTFEDMKKRVDNDFNLALNKINECDQYERHKLNGSEFKKPFEETQRIKNLRVNNKNSDFVNCMIRQERDKLVQGILSGKSFVESLRSEMGLVF